MILATSGIIASQIASFDADAVAFFNRVTTAGGSLSTTEKQAVNQLVLDLKANSLWTPMKAIYPMVGASAAACAQNLKSSSFTGTFTSGWTFASTGITPNGTSAYMNTGYNVNTEGSLNSAHISVYIRNNVATGSQIGAYVGGSFHHLYARYTDTKAYIGVNAIESSLSSTNSQGFWIGSRIISTVQKLYRNNTTFINATSVSTSKPNLNIYVGASNGSLVDYSSTQNAFASIGDGLTDTQASNFYTAVQAFQTTLNRQIAP
jgi:hypothetical protein